MTASVARTTPRARGCWGSRIVLRPSVAACMSRACRGRGRRFGPTCPSRELPRRGRCHERRSPFFSSPGRGMAGGCMTAVAERLTEAGVAVTAIDLPSNDGASGLDDDAAAVRTRARRDQGAHRRRRPLLRRGRRERGGGRGSERGRPRLSRGVHARHGRVAARRHAAPAPRLDRARRGGRLAPRAALRGGALRRLLAGGRRRGKARLSRQSVAAIATPQTQAAWQSLPSTYLICDEDRAVPPPAQEAMSRTRAQTVRRVPSSHSPFFSRPDDVADVVLQALGR